MLSQQRTAAHSDSHADRLYRLIFQVITLAAFTFSAFAADKTPPSGHGGAGIMNGTHCFKTTSTTITEVCADYKVGWKLWILMGEPVGDYTLNWKLRSFTVAGGEYGSVDFGSGYSDIPPALANALKSIELYVDAVASVAVSADNSESSYAPIASHEFNTGVGTRAGKNSFNSPGSPKWSEVFKGPGGYLHLSVEEAQAIFKSSHQPEMPIRLFNIRIGEKSSVGGLDVLESRIAWTCENSKNRTGYAICPAKKEKPKKEKAAADNSIEDAFDALEKSKGKKSAKSAASIDAAFGELDKGKTSKAGKGIDAAFDDVAAHLIEVERQRAALRAEEERQRRAEQQRQARHDEASRFCTAAFEAKQACMQKAECGGEPEKIVCTEERRGRGDCAPGNLCFFSNVCVTRGPNPKYAEWETCSANSARGCGDHTSARSMEECISARERR